MHASAIWEEIKAANTFDTYPSICVGKTRAQLDTESPSRMDGMSPADELTYRRSYCELIQESGKRLKMCALRFPCRGGRSSCNPNLAKPQTEFWIVWGAECNPALQPPSSSAIAITHASP